MLLDNEQQRELLLKLINSTNISASMSEIVTDLKHSIKTAEISVIQNGTLTKRQPEEQ